MILVEQHIIKKSDVRYEELDKLCMLSKNLYNTGLYYTRQYFFEHKKFLKYQALTSILSKADNVDYRELPAKVSQQTLKLLERNFKSFYVRLKNKKSDERVSIPKYMDKSKGRQVVTYTNQAISKIEILRGIVKLSMVKATVKTEKKNIQQVRVVPKNNTIVVEVLYKVGDRDLLPNNNRYAAIDLGLNNLATISSNVVKPAIINGKPVKSINQFFNKKRANLQSKLTNGINTIDKIRSLRDKRKNKINDYLHKASAIIVNHLVANDLNTLIIGNNKGWKQDINIGKRNNQNFVQVPHAVFVNMIEYKCKLRGINVVKTEESYTSKCSFLDNEPICKQQKYKGRRVKRGLFKSSDGRLINADVNGSLNILRKVVGNFNYDPIEVCSTPSVITVKYN